MTGPFDGPTGNRPAPPAYAHAARPRADRTLKLLLAGTVLCYALGYPLALIGHSNVGWIFVFLGGPLLIALIAVVIRRVQRSP